MAQAFGFVFVDGAFERKSFHQADGAEGQADAAFEDAALVEIEFEAAAAEIEDYARLDAIAQGPLDGLADQARFFFAADDFKFDAGFSADAVHEAAMVAGFAGGGGGDGAVGADVVMIHAIAKLAEGAGGAADGIAADDVAGGGGGGGGGGGRGGVRYREFRCAWEKWRER